MRMRRRNKTYTYTVDPETIAKIFMVKPPVAQLTTEEGTYHITGILDSLHGMFLAAMVAKGKPDDSFGYRITLDMPSFPIEEAPKQMLLEENITTQEEFSLDMLNRVEEIFEAGALMNIEFRPSEMKGVWRFKVISGWRTLYDPDDEEANGKFQLSLSDHYLEAVVQGGLVLPDIEIDVAGWYEQAKSAFGKLYD